MEEKLLKPVNEKCLFKKILVKDNKDTIWKLRTLIGKNTDSNFYPFYPFFVLEEGDNLEFGYEVDVYSLGKRCPGVIYGDEE